MWIAGSLLLAAILPLCQSSPQEERLITEVMESYRRGGFGSLVLPRKSMPDAVNVSFGAALVAVDIDTEKKLMTSHMWLRYSWNDPQLVWDPKDYGGLGNMRIPISLIWRPDIKLYNSHTLVMEQDETALAVVSNTGDILWMPNTRTTTRCYVQEGVWSTYFKFGSWTYDGWTIRLDFFDHLESFDMSYYTLGDLELLDQSARLNVMYYPCCQEPYPTMDFSLTARGRRDSSVG